ncbi:hypothetical protein ABZP36_003997 [Zizania latifolia]
MDANADLFRNKLDAFLEAVSLALPQPILGTPSKVQRNKKGWPASTATRRSSRLAKKNSAGIGPSELALKVLAKKLGLSSSASNLASGTVSQQLTTMFNQELGPDAIQAIRDLVTVGQAQMIRQKNGKAATESSAPMLGA